MKTQYSRRAVLAIWAAAALPMAIGSWVVAPWLAHGRGPRGFAEALIITLTVGLFWQFLLVLGLVVREQRSLRWRAIQAALWLGPPQGRSGRRGGRLWWWALVVTVGVGLVELLPVNPSMPANRDMGAFLGSDAGRDLLRHNWALFAVVVAMCVFNTVLGEELLFRGLLLPRMAAAFGSYDWVTNAVLFGLYHLHQPWSIPGAMLGGGLQAYATKRLRSAWMGIISHSAQSVIIIGLTLSLVLA